MRTGSMPIERTLVTDVHEAAEVAEVPERRSTRDWLTGRIDGRVAVAVAATWLLVPQIAIAIEPPARRSEPLIGVLLAVAMYTLFVVIACGLATRRRWGLAASLAGAVLATVAEIACPVSGHHQFGTWWYGGMACMLTLVAVSVAALCHEPPDRAA